MTAIVLLVMAVALIALCVSLIVKLPNNPAGIVFKIVLSLAGGFLTLWLVWTLIMAVFVGPALRKQNFGTSSPTDTVAPGN